MIQGSPRQNMVDSGLRIEAAAKLEDLLAFSFEESHFGFSQFSDVEDLWLRAVLSDETRQAASGVLTNLYETLLHEDVLRRRVGQGLPYAGTGSDGATFRLHAEVDLNVAGFLRAFGSTLDCLAATAIGVLRAGWDIRRADWDMMNSLANPPNRIARELKHEVPGGQKEAWEGIGLLGKGTVRLGSEGWLEWGLEARNAAVHRSRQLRVAVPVPAEFPSGFVAISHEPVGAQLQAGRYIPHLRRRPWMSDMEDIARAGNADRLIFDEPATETLGLLRASLNDLVESISAALLRHWTVGHFSAEPLVVASRRGLIRSPPAGSAAFAARAVAGGPTSNATVGHSDLKRRLLIAQTLREGGHLPEAPKEK